MPHDPRFDVLFEQVPVGPVTARNRFFQVPHCNGMGYRDPKALAAMRGTKAAGGWAVVSTEEAEIHPSSKVSPYIEGRIWDDADLPAHELVVDAIRAYGARRHRVGAHRHGRCQPIHPRSPDGPEPPAPRPMDQPDPGASHDQVGHCRSPAWHRAAAERSIRAGYDIVYCTFTGEPRRVDGDAVVPVTGRLPDDAPARDLEARRDRWTASGLVAARAVGDALSPGTIASAVWDGTGSPKTSAESTRPPCFAGASPTRAERHRGRRPLPSRICAVFANRDARQGPRAVTCDRRGTGHASRVVAAQTRNTPRPGRRTKERR